MATGYLYAIGAIAALIIAICMTPLVKKFAHAVGAIDVPNHRKVHSTVMPRLGGLAIYIAFVAAYFIVAPFFPEGFISASDMNLVKALLVGGTMIVIVGAFDDRYELSPKIKLLGQLAAACVVVFGFGVEIDLVNIPFGDAVQPIENWISIPITIFWIVGVTNAINLIDGLDGLAAGVSGIAIASILAMAILMSNEAVILLSALLLGGIVGFLFFNFHPAKIFMGDSGALFLGFSLSMLSLLGFKQIALVSFVAPLLVIGVPLSDTFFAIVRRWVNKRPIFAADKGHLHHCLRELGFSHRATVLVIYGIAVFFGASAVTLSILYTATSANWVIFVAICILVFILQIGAEVIGIVDKSKRPVLNLLARLIVKPQTNSRSK